MKIQLDVISGVEGACLSVGAVSGDWSKRVAGPKPWGGGRVVHSFTVDAAAIEAVIADIRRDSDSTAEDGDHGAE